MADVRADEPAPASSSDSRSGPEAPAIPPAACQAPASDIGQIAPGTREPRADSVDVPVSPQPPEAQVAPVWDVDASAPAATDSLDVDRMLDRLTADPPIQTVVDQVAAEFGTQEAVDEILRSMTQSKEQ